MKALCIAMGKTRFNDKEKNAEYCQLCMENLTRSTLNWFSRFEPNSTEKITKLYTVFMKYYFIFIEKENRIPTYIWTMSQKREEYLCSFIWRFNYVTFSIAVHDKSGITALWSTLWHELCFRDNLLLDQPTTHEDALTEKNTLTSKHKEKTRRRWKLFQRSTCRSLKGPNQKVAW